MEKVSIIVPVYKVEAYLHRCVESLVKQTYPYVEVILVDDGSPDGSGAMCDALAKEDGRIVVIHQENQGVSAARNQGLRVITGDWVCFCDGDDWYEPNFVERMLECADNENADYVICNYQIVSDGQIPIVSGSLGDLISGCDSREVIACGPTSSCTHMIRKELIEKSQVSYPVGLRQYEEMPVIPVLAKYATKIGIINEPLYNYFQRGDGTSASNSGSDSEENFYKACKLMEERLGAGYGQEVEYHAIYALFYGEILKMCKLGMPASAIKKQIHKYEEQFPSYLSNPYLPKLGKAKQFFLKLCHVHSVIGLRLLACVHSMIVR